MKENLSKIYAQEMPVMVGETLESVVIKLEKLNKDSKSYYAIFNGQVLYSSDVTMDSAFKKCLNISRKVYLYRYKQWLAINNIDENAVKTYVAKNLEEWINKGKKYIIKERMMDFETLCRTLANNINSYMVIEQFIKVCELLNKNVYYDEILYMIDSFNNSPLNNNILFDIILNYTYAGPNFYAYSKTINNLEYKYINNIKRLNKKLKYKSEYNKACKELMHREIKRLVFCDNDKNIIFEGYVLMNKNNEFEGAINNEYIVSGSIKNSYISMDYYNMVESKTYYGAKISSNDSYECYDELENVWHIYLQDCNRTFREELFIEKDLEDLKAAFEMNTDISKKLVK